MGQGSILPTFLIEYKNKWSEYSKDTYNKRFVLKTQEGGNRKMEMIQMKSRGKRTNEMREREREEGEASNEAGGDYEDQG